MIEFNSITFFTFRNRIYSFYLKNRIYFFYFYIEAIHFIYFNIKRTSYFFYFNKYYKKLIKNSSKIKKKELKKIKKK